MQAVRRSIWNLFTVALLAAGLFAQTTTTGDLAGTVTDPSGAVVPNATVTITNDATGSTQTVVTNGSGFYRAASLAPGSYTIGTNVQGFAPAKKRADVAVGTATTINIVLGNVSAQQTVEVTAEAPVIQTENGNVTNTHDTREIELVPNGGGDQTYIAQTTPGVNINTASGGGYGNFSAFGMPGTSNLFTVNGNDNMDPYLNLNNSGATNLTLGANELAEVSVVDNGYSVQYGRQAGAQVNSVTKSGGNQFHGNAVYYWNGRVMNANNWFNKHVQPGSPVTDRGFVNANQWSASLGGPIKKDKTFFFVDTEGLRVIVPVPAQVFVPSPQFETYVLGTSLPAAGQAASVPYYQKLFNIYNTSPGASNATAANTLAVDPNGGCGDFNGTAGFGAGGVPCALGYHSDFPNFAREWTLAARIDHQLTANDKMYIRYHQDKGVQPTYTDPLNPIFNTDSNQPSYDGQLNETHTFGTRAVNQFILSGAYYRAIFVNPQQAASLAAYPVSTIFVDGLFSGLGGINYDFPQGRNVTQYQIVDDLSYNVGNHTIKVGTNYRRNDVTDYTTGVLTVPLQEVFSMTDFATGISDLAEQRFPQRMENPIALYSIGVYGEDDWKASPNLTLTLGLRVDHDSNPVCQTNCFNRLPTSFEQASHDNTLPYNQAISTNLHQAFPSTDTLLWQPRVGFAWQPFGSNHATVVRGGAGVFYDLLAGFLVDNFIRNAPGDITLVDTTGTNFAYGVPNSTFSLLQNGAAQFQQQFASGGTFQSIAANVPGFSGISYQTTQNKIKTAQYQEWNLEIEQGIGSKNSVSANYVGNHGLHIPLYDPWENVACRNAATCGNLAPTITTTRPNSAFSTVRELTSEAYSHYDGLVLAFQRKFSAGLQGQVSYTWSHSLDTVSNGGLLPWSGNDSLLTQLSPFGQALNYGSSDYDVRHSINANYVYELPFKFGNGIVNNIVGGWTISGTLFFHSGYPFTVTDTSDFQTLVRNGSSTATPAEIIGPVDYSSCTRGPEVTVNPNNPDTCLPMSSFQQFGVTGPVPAFFSNQHRNQFRGPGYFNTDLSLRKAFKLSERFRLSIGANAYNILNHPNFGNPNGAVDGGALGSYFTTVNPPTSALGSGLGGDASARSIQLEGRLTF